MTSPSPTVERLIAGITLGIAFLVMASIIVPDPTEAHDGDHAATIGPDASHGEGPDLPSTDPHEGLRSLGSLDCNGYRLDVYATQVGPRYTVCDPSGDELGVLLTAEQVQAYYPELPLPELDFSASSTIMMAEPESRPW
ncbi:MAG: hypothetical protein ACYTJ0_19280 [Planctomycetota bacterium]|jgi:hypothetical protein